MLDILLKAIVPILLLVLLITQGKDSLDIALFVFAPTLLVWLLALIFPQLNSTIKSIFAIIIGGWAILMFFFLLLVSQGGSPGWQTAALIFSPLIIAGPVFILLIRNP
jgi:Mg/Co/Ni transporter MgtE